MRIDLDDKHILVSDEYCNWIVCIVDSKEGKSYEKRVSGYYPTIEGAVESYINKKINSSEAETMKQLAGEVKALKKEVRAWKLKLTDLK